MDSKSSEVLVGKAILAIAGVEFEVVVEEVAFVEAIVVDSSSDTMKDHRGKLEKIERERERERERISGIEKIRRLMNEYLITMEFVNYNIYTTKKA